jgi:uncharacterized membrane protein YuzA (DUF378 family)
MMGLIGLMEADLNLIENVFGYFVGSVFNTL